MIAGPVGCVELIENVKIRRQPAGFGVALKHRRVADQDRAA